MPALQAMVVPVLLLLLIVFAIRAADRSRGDLVVALHGVVFWLFPLVVGSAVALFRADALLLPVAVLARHLPRALLAGVLAVAAGLWICLAVLGFESRIV